MHVYVPMLFICILCTFRGYILKQIFIGLLKASEIKKLILSQINGKTKYLNIIKLQSGEVLKSLMNTF